MQTFVKCPFCGKVYDAATERSVAVMVDGVQRTAHLSCVMLRTSPPAEAKPNGDVKPNGPVQAEAAT